ncbi:MAG: hypothetical protein AB7L71_00845 [Vicinamibacterales bacterium]
MTPKPDSDTPSFEVNLTKLVKDHARQVFTIAGAASALVLLPVLVYMLMLQPVRRASVLEFRPTFNGAGQGEYPNGLPFSSSDVAAGAVVDVVYDGNSIGEYCSREAFRGGFFVEQRSDASAFLDAEYQARLSDPRLTPVERQGVQLEYEAKRAALPVQFRLVFVKPRSCAAIPQVVVTKVMTDVLTTWANESEAKRGVLNHQVEVLTPGMLDVGAGIESSRLLRADLLRTALLRIVANVDAVQHVPGSGLIRYGPARLTFMEVRSKLVDLVRSRLEPLVATAGQSMAREALAWVTATVASAEREQQAAAGKASANREALQLYSGMAQAAPGIPGSKAGSSVGADVQTLSPQIDSTFIDRIVEMSEANTAFRQQLTTAMVSATVEAVEAEERAAYYRRLLETLRSTSGVQMSPTEIDARLDDIVAQGKELTRQFNELYEEFSRVSLRAAAAMYQTEKPVTTEVSRNFAVQDLLMLVFGTFLLSLLVAFGYFAISSRLAEDAEKA